jgi:hypothetical protein
MKTDRGVEVLPHVFLISARNGGRFTAREIVPVTHLIWGRMGPRAGLDVVTKIKKILSLSEIELRSSNP